MPWKASQKYLVRSPLWTVRPPSLIYNSGSFFANPQIFISIWITVSMINIYLIYIVYITYTSCVLYKEESYSLYLLDFGILAQWVSVQLQCSVLDQSLFSILYIDFGIHSHTQLMSEAVYAIIQVIVLTEGM